jgi:glycosyltransferase involved in cell wall biosynthesis
MQKIKSTLDKSSLSVAVITQNEAENLPACLESVAFAEQIVVVDSGSTDPTIDIARSFGCEVFLEPWRGGFGAQKQFALDQCRHPWILVLDADERIPPETAIIIKDIVAKKLPGAAGYSFPRKNFFQGRWIKHAGWWPDRIIRLFQKDLGRMTEAIVHEAIHLNGPVNALDVPIEHYTESRLSALLLKIDKYSTLGAQEAFREGKTASIWSAALRAKLTFFQNYILRLGFLDGFQGFTLAITDAVNKFFKYAKLAEMSQQVRKKS